jgi:hypothetical protein
MEKPARLVPEEKVLVSGRIHRHVPPGGSPFTRSFSAEPRRRFRCRLRCYRPS